ncbi:hypothetical protein OH492_16655 [Vibrio chagasii]|nr:hypothetical protein [Vibrio chagasii]
MVASGDKANTLTRMCGKKVTAGINIPAELVAKYLHTARRWLIWSNDP